LEVSAVALAAVAALLTHRRRRLSTVLTSLGLMIASATIVHDTAIRDLSSVSLERAAHVAIPVPRCATV
jgi:hypothetical protein